MRDDVIVTLGLNVPSIKIEIPLECSNMHTHIHTNASRDETPPPPPPPSRLRALLGSATNASQDDTPAFQIKSLATLSHYSVDCTHAIVSRTKCY